MEQKEGPPQSMEDFGRWVHNGGVFSTYEPATTTKTKNKRGRRGRRGRGRGRGGGMFYNPFHPYFFY